MAFTVRDFADLIRLLEDNPEWRAQLLRVLFPEAFLNLPRALEALAEARWRTEATLNRVTERIERGFAEAAAERQRIEQRVEQGFAEARDDRLSIWEAIRESNDRMERGFAEAAAERRRIEQGMEQGFAATAANFGEVREDIRGLKADVLDLKVDVAGLKVDVGGLKADVRDLKGDSRERFYRDRATGIFGRWLRHGHDAASEVSEQLRAALQGDRISDREYDQALASDLLWGGTLVETSEPVVLVAETWSP